MNENETTDILEESLDDTSLRMSLLPKNLYKFSCTKMEDTRTKECKLQEGQFDLIKITFSLQEDATDIDGRPVHKGFPMFEQVYTLITEKNSKVMIQQRLKRIKLALQGQTAAGPFKPYIQYLGLIALLGIKIEPARTNPKGGEDFPPHNSIDWNITLKANGIVLK